MPHLGAPIEHESDEEEPELELLEGEMGAGKDLSDEEVEEILEGLFRSPHDR